MFLLHSSAKRVRFPLQKKSACSSLSRDTVVISPWNACQAVLLAGHLAGPAAEQLPDGAVAELLPDGAVAE